MMYENNKKNIYQQKDAASVSEDLDKAEERTG